MQSVQHEKIYFHTSTLKEALQYWLAIKKAHRVTESSQKVWEWLKPYTDMNVELREKKLTLKRLLLVNEQCKFCKNCWKYNKTQNDEWQITFKLLHKEMYFRGTASCRYEKTTVKIINKSL